ncbi:MAG: hypothetical protein FJX55_10875 [Alphaproteobacteria bacterium]|nr:hypothetical protein [Alphaproteobacteria bacterium]
MPQSLQDIEDRLELLKMTLGMFAPEEPAPIAAELVQLGEEIFENWLLAVGETPVEAGGGELRLLALQAQCAAKEPGFATCRAACLELIDQSNLVTGEPDHAATAERLLMAVAADFHLYSFVTGRLAAGSPGRR